MLTKDYFDEIRGAAYIPVRTCNAYQHWKEYSSEVTERDFSFAGKLNINAIRLWVSYEYWLEDPMKFKASFENLLSIADKKGIRIMPSLFECCGKEPTPEHLVDRDQFTCDAVRSPGTEITEDRTRWSEPFSFLDWFMDEYKFDSRILAIEVTNEPKNTADQILAIALLKRAQSAAGSRPITLGAEVLADNVLYDSYIDIYQTHENMHESEGEFRHILDRSRIIQEINKKPVWVTEWQQIRPGGWGFGEGQKVDKKWLRPRHFTMAPIFQEYGLGNFVWNLMLRPAYLSVPRSVGTFNGLFHEDGSVYSLKDAQAVANNPELKLKENKTLPACFDRVAAMSE